jgi:hypothetical protein
MRGRKGFVFAAFGAAPGAGRLLAVAVLMMLAVTSAIGQTPADSADRAPAQRQADSGPQTGNPNAPGSSRPGAEGLPQSASESEKARLAVNPVTGMAVLSRGNYVPLTGKERWTLYWKQNYFSVGAYFGPLLTSVVLDQAANSPPEWGSGLSGYGRRLASRTGSAMIQGSVQAVAAAALQEDVRYVQSERQGGARRALHAIAYSFLTYNRQGNPTLNVANLGAYYASTAISTAWLPSKESAARYTLTNGTLQIALGVPVNLLQEFWPELMQKIRRRR